MSPAFLFWGSPAITVAVVAHASDRPVYARQVLLREVAKVEEAKPKYAEHLRRVATMLGVA